MSQIMSYMKHLIETYISHVSILFAKLFTNIAL